MELTPEVKAFLQQSITAAIGSEVKPLVDKIATDKFAEFEKKASTGIGLEDVKGEIASALKMRDDENTKRRSERDAKAAIVSARNEFIKSNAQKLPAVYHSLIPETDDVEQLKAACEKAFAQLKTDQQAMGIKPVDFGTASAAEEKSESEATKSELTRAEFEKMSPVEQRSYLADAAGEI